MIMMKKMWHKAILVVSTKDLNNSNNRTIQTDIIISHCIFPSCKANTTPIRTVVVDCVACNFMLHKGAQAEVKSNTHFVPIDHQRDPAPEWMQFAAATMAVGQKTIKNNPFHDDFCIVSEDQCLLCSEVL